MYVRGAKNREDGWLLEGIERMGLDDSAFRPREFAIALDETTGDKAGFGRLRVHDDVPEITSLGVIESWREQGVGAHVVERLVQHASDEGFEEVYALAPEPDYLLQFGFEPVERSTLPDPLSDRFDAEREGETIVTRLTIGDFSMPSRLRQRFKDASPAPDERAESDMLPAEEFGIDPDTATYKYDTQGRQ